MSRKYLIHDLQSFFRRNSVTIALTVIALCILGIFYLQALTIQRLSDEIASQNSIISQTKTVLDQTKHITEQIAQSSQQRTKQIDDLNDHLDCIVKFFSQADRGQKAIDDIRTCRLKTVAADSPTATQVQDSISTEQQSASAKPKAKPSTSGKSSGAASSPSTGAPAQPTAPTPQPSLLDRATSGVQQLLNSIKGLL